ncbi:hypothetical protein [Guptibacillus hwajinpoensis]|uniref:ABC transmembrane type-1 domain-containing protein n=1 Tax=Guptibacillus hwajinpoensis TaxID=208199 RepID=A0A0J6D1U3_9BACL|nr:hypothetical protein [Alkalihalobacillus macyae]KMM39320.1 hypothetical protein AB986_08945 [Alkalihalobacillus macyae]
MLPILIRNKRFMIGSSFIFILILSSVLYSVIADNSIPTAEIITNENGDIVARPPYSPWDYPPFGTDQISQDLFFVILIGAKYTIGIALVIALSRFLFSSILGIFMQLYCRSFLQKVKPVFEGLYYFPASLLAYLCLSWVLMKDGFLDGFSTTFTERVLFEMVVLILIGVPIVLINVSKEVSIIQKKEFIDSVKVLGGSRFHLLRVHLMPYLRPQLFLLFVREVIQVLLLLAHLGILNILFGGALLTTDMFDKAVYVSFSSEWSGLIGSNFRFLFTDYYWIPLVPIFCFTIAILAFKLMIEGFEATLYTKACQSAASAKVDSKKDIKDVRTGVRITNNSFDYL